MTVRAAALVFAMATLAPAAAAAQQPERFTAGGSAGVARTWDDESMLGGGVVAEGRFGLNLTSRTQVELVLTQIPFTRRFESGVGTDGRSILAGLMVKHDFTSGAVRPFVSAGYTLNQFRGTRTDPSPAASRTSTTDHGYIVGTGFVIARGRWQAGPEVRGYMLQIERDSSAAMILSGSIRANYRF